MINKKIRVVINKEEMGDVNIDELINIPDDYFSEINVIDVLNTGIDENTALDLLFNKLAPDGILSISGEDGVDMCRRVYYGEVSIQAASNFFKIMPNIITTSSLQSFFKAQDADIEFMGIKNGRFLIKVKKK